jgi:LuxR family maltose regulon positive regulatory protein
MDTYNPLKFALPNRPAFDVLRPRLLEQLNEGLGGGRRLLLITAPPGSGKTTLVSDWARAGGHRCCWLTLDDGDNDPSQFWSNLAGAMALHFPGLQETVQAVLRGDPLHQLSADTLPRVLINALAEEEEPLVLVLDDYHLIQNVRIHGMVGRLLESAPPCFFLAVTSRAEPPLELARLRARGALTEIRMDALSFSDSETAQWLNASMRLALSADEIAQLNRRTEGWAAGLQLFALALQEIRRRENPPRAAGELLCAFSGGHRHVADYLADEVLRRQSREVQDFLLQTSLLEKLTAPLCEAVTGSGGAQSMLETLERANLFLVPLDSKREWYRYPSLWAEMLQARLRREQPELPKTLHRRAATWFAGNGFPSEAIDHALAAGDSEEAARLMEDSARDRVLRGEGAALLARMEKLPAGEAARPRLLLDKSLALVLEGRLDEAGVLLDDLSRREGLSQLLLGEIAAVRSIVATIRQDTPAIMEYSREALRLIPREESYLRCSILLSRGTAAALSGEAGQAVDLLTQALEESRLGNQPILRLMALGTLAQTYESLGHFDRAEELHRRLIALESDPLLGRLPLIGVGYVGLGGVLHERLRFGEAEAALRKGLEIGRRWSSPEILIGGWFSLARLRFTQGYPGEAAAVLDRLEGEHGSNLPLHESGHIQALRALYDLALGRKGAADAWARRTFPSGEPPVTFCNESRLLVLVRVLRSRGDAGRVRLLLDRLEDAARAGERNSLIEILLLQALDPELPGTAKLDIVEEALASAEPQNQRRVFMDEPECAQLLRAYQAGRPGSAFAAGLLGDLERRAGVMKKPIPLLSPREMDVLRLIAAGLANLEIAERLVVTLPTVKSHVKHILSKLDAQNRTQAVARARERKIL